MPDKEVFVSIRSNNSEIENLLLEKKLHHEICFSTNLTKNNSHFIFLVDFQKSLANVSQNLIDTYLQCQKFYGKLAVVLLHGQSLDVEKNQYFNKMLTDLGKSKPLHRLIITKDIYQNHISTPITPFDKFLFESISSNNINISEKGENLFFPLSIEELIKGLVKTLFLSNTSGETFYLLGDPLPDLELAYLLKKNIYTATGEELEINAAEKNNPETKNLLSLSHKTRGELNWNPESDILFDLKKQTSLFLGNPPKGKTGHYKPNLFYGFINWLYRPRPKKESKLPSLAGILKKTILVSALSTILIFISSIVCIGLSLYKLENSLNQALSGNLKSSVSSLTTSVKVKTIGESLYSPLTFISNLISPQETEKIYNTFSLLDYGANSLENLHQTYVIAESVLQSLNNHDSKTNYGDLSLALHSSLSQVYENLNQIELLTKANKIPLFIEEKIKTNAQYQNLGKLENQITQFIKVTDLIPAIFAEDRANTILVLLQNSKINQPNGGRVEYYLFLTLDKGRLVSKKYYAAQEMENIYQKTQIPTQKSKKIISLPSTLQELSQNPDFAIASKNLSLAIEKFLKYKPDFIIATNDSLIEQLQLEDTSKSNEIPNFDIQTSTGIEEYRDKFDYYLDRFMTNNLSLPVIGKTLASQIDNSQILIWSSDEKIERIIFSQSFSGNIHPHPCNASLAGGGTCTPETIYLSEASVSLSNPKAYDSRTVEHTVTITPSSIEHEYQINFKIKPDFQSVNQNSLIYHLYTLSPSHLDKVILNNLPASIKDVSKESNHYFDHYQIPVTLSQTGDSTILIKFFTRQDQAFTFPLSYSLTEYRQPGIDDAGTTLKIFYPDNLRPSVVTSQFTAEPSKMTVTLPSHTSTFGFTLVGI